MPYTVESCVPGALAALPMILRSRAKSCRWRPQARSRGGSRRSASSIRERQRARRRRSVVDIIKFTTG